MINRSFVLPHELEEALTLSQKNSQISFKKKFEEKGKSFSKYKSAMELVELTVARAFEDGVIFLKLTKEQLSIEKLLGKAEKNPVFIYKLLRHEDKNSGASSLLKLWKIFPKKELRNETHQIALSEYYDNRTRFVENFLDKRHHNLANIEFVFSFEGKEFLNAIKPIARDLIADEHDEINEKQYIDHFINPSVKLAPYEEDLRDGINFFFANNHVKAHQRFIEAEKKLHNLIRIKFREKKYRQTKLSEEAVGNDGFEGYHKIYYRKALSNFLLGNHLFAHIDLNKALSYKKTKEAWCLQALNVYISYIHILHRNRSDIIIDDGKWFRLKYARIYCAKALRLDLNYFPAKNLLGLIKTVGGHYYKLGLSAEAQKKYKLAEKYFYYASETEEDNYQVSIHKANCNIEMQNHEFAYKDLLKVLRLKKLPEVYYLLVKCACLQYIWVVKNNGVVKDNKWFSWQAIKDHYEKALILGTNYAGAKEIGALFDRVKILEEKRTKHTKLVSKASVHEQKLNRPDETPILPKIKGSIPKQIDQNLVVQKKEALMPMPAKANPPAPNSDLQRSMLLESLNKLIKDKPCLENLYSRGILYFGFGDFARAIDDFNQVINLDKCHKESILLRGKCFIALAGDAENTKMKNNYCLKAKKDFNSAIKSDKKNIELYLLRAKAFKLLGNIDCACSDFFSAIEIDAKAVGSEKEFFEVFAQKIEKKEEWLKDQSTKFASGKIKFSGVRKIEKSLSKLKENVLVWVKNVTKMQTPISDKKISYLLKRLAGFDNDIKSTLQKIVGFIQLKENENKTTGQDGKIGQKHLDKPKTTGQKKLANNKEKQAENHQTICFFPVNVKLDLADKYNVDGCAAAKKREYKKAIKLFARAIKSNPKKHYLYFNLAAVEEALGKFSTAKENYRKALHHIADNDVKTVEIKKRCLEQLILIYIKEKDYCAAADCCHLRGMQEIGQKEYINALELFLKARECLEKAKTRRSKKDNCFDVLIEDTCTKYLKKISGEKDAIKNLLIAIANLERLEKKYPGLPVLWTYLGLAHYFKFYALTSDSINFEKDCSKGLGVLDLKQAKSCFEKAISLDSNYPSPKEYLNKLPALKKIAQTPQNDNGESSVQKIFENCTLIAVTSSDRERFSQQSNFWSKSELLQDTSYAKFDPKPPAPGKKI